MAGKRVWSTCAGSQVRARGVLARVCVNVLSGALLGAGATALPSAGFLLLLSPALTGCSQTTEREEPGAVSNALEVANADAADPPASNNGARAERPPHPLASVASIVEGTVKRTWNEFDERLGPRTFVELADVKVHAGRRCKEYVFSQLGGPMPDGGGMDVSGLPEFSEGARYILFLAKQATLYSPVWYDLAFRIEEVGNRKLVLGPQGQPVLTFSKDDVRFGKTSLVARNIELSTPNAPAVFKAAEAANDPDARRAMAPAAFIASAISATLEMGGPVDQDVDLKPDATVRWDSSETTPSE